VTVVVADHNTMGAAVYRALAARKVQVRSLMAAWMMGMGASCPKESTGTSAHTKLRTRRSPWPGPRGVSSAALWTGRPGLVTASPCDGWDLKAFRCPVA